MLASCLSSNGKPLQGSPGPALLSILGVLRRRATSADALPPGAGPGFGDDIYVRYVRRARVVAGTTYFIFPVLVSACGRAGAHEGIWEWATHVPIGHGLYGGEGGGGATASAIEQGRDLGGGPPGSSRSSTLEMVVPDGVAMVTLHLRAGPANGFHKSVISPPATITTAVVNNLVVVRVPRSSGTATATGDTMTWRAADGHIIKTFNRL